MLLTASKIDKNHQKDQIMETLSLTKGNISSSARILNCARTTLMYYVRKHGIDLDQLRGGDGGQIEAREKIDHHPVEKKTEGNPET